MAGLEGAGFDFGSPEDPRLGDWTMAAMCSKCGFQVEAEADELLDAISKFGCCPKCGALIVRQFATHQEPPGSPFRLVRRRWLATGLMVGHYEIHPDDA